MEREFVDWLTRRIAPAPGVTLGIGDDAAIVQVADGQCVVSSDMLMDGVHFQLNECGAQLAGRKSLAVNLSDMAAMGAIPKAAVVAMALPRSGAADVARQLMDGILMLAEQYQCAIAGGDTNVWDGPLVVSITILGQCHPRGVLRRDGALVGDRVLVTGALGRSITGHHLHFQPRIDEARTLLDHHHVHACADVSDGLALDAHRMATASGCGICLETEKIPLSDATRQQSASPEESLAWALGDGEDFELLSHDFGSRGYGDRSGSAERTLSPRSGPASSSHGLWQTDNSGWNLTPESARL